MGVMIYFCGSIRGGRADQPLYLELINYLNQNFGKVLSEHIGYQDLSVEQQTFSGERAIYERDYRWIQDAEFIVAEVSTPSIGVGREIEYAVRLNKHILCLYRPEEGRNLSALIAGDPQLNSDAYPDFWKSDSPFAQKKNYVRSYQNLEEAKQIVQSCFEAWNVYPHAN